MAGLPSERATDTGNPDAPDAGDSAASMIRSPSSPIAPHRPVDMVCGSQGKSAAASSPSSTCRQRVDMLDKSHDRRQQAASFLRLGARRMAEARAWQHKDRARLLHRQSWIFWLVQTVAPLRLPVVNFFDPFELHPPFVDCGAKLMRLCSRQACRHCWHDEVPDGCAASSPDYWACI